MMMMEETTNKDEKPAEEFDEQGLKIITLPLIGTKMREKTYLILLETFGVLMALFSTITAIIAFNKMKAASNDVANIVANWDTVPVKNIAWVDRGTQCPDGYSMIAPMATSGSGAMCACASGAKYYLSPNNGNTVTRDAFSGPGACYTNQSSPTLIPDPYKSIYKCVTVPADIIPAVSLSSWMGQVQCVERGFTNAINTKSPDDTGACPTGTHQCGSAKLPLCINDSFDANACPVNWQADTSATAAYGFSTTSQIAELTQANLGVAPTTFSYGGSSSYANNARSGSHYTQVGKVFVGGAWTPLPVVEIGNSVGVPCYGEEGTPSSGTQSKLGGTSINGNINIGSPASCSQGTDARYMASKNYPLGQLVFENAYAQLLTSCATTTQANVDYFASATKCSGTTGATACVISTTTSTLFRTTCPTTGASCCAAGDKVCEYAAYQSTCGQWQNVATTNTQTAAFYQKAQIYWSAECPYTKDEVVSSNTPLQKAINIQKVLLILNTIVNVVLILLGSYIAYLCYKKNNVPTTHYQDLENIWKPRATTFGTLIKMPVIIATIVVTKAITNFFVTVGDKNCAGTDAMGMVTNKTFTTLAEVLPSVVSANSATLAMDILGFLPALYAYIKPCFAFEEGGLPDVGPSNDKKGTDLNSL